MFWSAIVLPFVDLWCWVGVASITIICLPSVRMWLPIGLVALKFVLAVGLWCYLLIELRSWMVALVSVRRASFIRVGQYWIVLIKQMRSLFNRDPRSFCCSLGYSVLLHDLLCFIIQFAIVSLWNACSLMASISCPIQLFESCNRMTHSFWLKFFFGLCWIWILL